MENEEVPSSDGSSRPKRFMVRLACAACRKAHASCSSDRPCRRCLDRGLPCVDDDQGPRSKKPRSSLSTHSPAHFSSMQYPPLISPGMSVGSPQQFSASMSRLDDYLNREAANVVSGSLMLPIQDPVMAAVLPANAASNTTNGSSAQHLQQQANGTAFPSVILNLSENARGEVMTVTAALLLLRAAFHAIVPHTNGKEAAGTTVVLDQVCLPGQQLPTNEKEMQLLFETPAWRAIASHRNWAVVVNTWQGATVYVSEFMSELSGVSVAELTARSSRLFECVRDSRLDVVLRRYYGLGSDPRVVLYRTVEEAYRTGEWLTSQNVFLRDDLGRSRISVTVQTRLQPGDWVPSLGRGEDVVYEGDPLLTVVSH